MNKSVGYTRVSSQGQVSGNGLERQRKAIEDTAKRNKVQLETIFEDSISGTLIDREGLQDCIDYCVTHNINIIIIERLDRLARDLIASEYIIRDIQSKGITLISSQEGIDLGASDASRVLIRQVFGAVAEYDKTQLVTKLRIARNKVKSELGKCEGSKGYRDIDKDTLKLVRRLRRKPRASRRKRMTYNAIAKHLNDSEVKTLRGKRWNYNSVKYILSI